MNENNILYEEDENGILISSSLENYIKVPGVWALYGKDKETQKLVCLNVGKSKNVGNEILYDISCLHLLKIRSDGTKRYINQFNEDCAFTYSSGQTQEYLYPILASRYNSFKFIYICDNADISTEKKYARDNHALFWRNGRPYRSKALNK